MKKIVKDALILTLITLIAGLSLGFVHEITKKPIEKAEKAAIEKAYSVVFSNADSFEDLKGFDSKKATSYVKNKGYSGVTINSVAKALDKNGKELGYVIGVCDGDSYGGDVVFYMGINMDKTMNGYSITEISDTPGLGMKAKEPKFMNEFKGLKSGKYEVSKTGEKGKIEAISGATITSKAVTTGVNAGFSYFEYLVGGNK
ncbi:MAG: RnfABCDGE type electron transport complex subunit G [Lachnospiraceae bacterium]|nr:RnfABCDGE type electron transport complex subunit G [Lachnospiraceae bacterium]